MTDLQKPNQELITPPDTLLVKVSEPVYQMWYETVQTMNQRRASTAEKQQEIFKKLMEWAEYKYPGYGVVNFQDYNNLEAAEMSRKCGRTITWGMYVLLQIGGSMQPISITDKLLNDATI
jgi:hypothetical protein